MSSFTLKQMKEMGNIKSNAIFNPNELRHPPPPNMIDSERDSDLEKYIRCKCSVLGHASRDIFLQLSFSVLNHDSFAAKYEFKSFFDKKALVASKLGPSRSASSRLSAVLPDSAAPQPSARPLSVAVTAPSSSSIAQSTPSVPAAAPVAANPSLAAARAPIRSVSVPVIGQPAIQQPQHIPQPPQPQIPVNNATFNDLISLQGPTTNASLPLQFTATSLNTPTASTSLPMSIPGSASQLGVTNPYSNLSANPASALPSTFTQTTGISPGGIGRSMSLNTGLNFQQPMTTGISPNFNTGLNPSPLMQSNMTLGQNPMMMAGSQTPSPNPFAPQALPQMQSPTGMSTMSAPPMFGAMTGMSMQQPLQPNFTSQSFQQPSPFQPQQQQQPFQAQPQMSGMVLQPQAQMYQPQPTMFQPAANTNPFMQMQSQTPQLQPSFTPTPQFGGTPSPMMGMQGLPQMQMQMQMQQQPQQQAVPNQFTSWLQGPSGTNGFAGQQQWSGM